MPNSNYTVGDPKAEQLIHELVEYCENPNVSDLLHQIFTSIVKMGCEHKDRGDFKLTNTTLKEFRHAFRVFYPYRKTSKVVMFGSARTSSTEPNYIMAQELAKALVDEGYMIISGAGGGIMEAANRGAGKGNSFGINIKLPQEQLANDYIKGDSKLMTFKYFFTRKLMLIKESDATILFPGGFGTLDEGFENLTLFQTGKSKPHPIVMIEPENGTYWQHWREYVEKELQGGKYISDFDLNLFYVAHSIPDAVEYIKLYYKNFHSLRYVGDHTVIRLKRKLTESHVQYLNENFSDLLKKGHFESSEAMETEVTNREFTDLPRLIFKSDRKHFGRLNELIIWVNKNV